MKNVYVFFADGFEEIEAMTSVDVLKRAALNVTMVSVTDHLVVTGAHGVEMVCNCGFNDRNYLDADLLVLPGGMPGASTLSDHEGLKALLVKFAGAEKPIGAICAAPMALGKLGLLKNKTVTCYPGFESYLEGAQCTGNSVERSGNIITGNGPGASMEFALSLVELMCGQPKVLELKEAMRVK